ncbi:hypothetical protein HYQ46_003352 [Verticillium longisporum]|nr:hypothetical protein HYQ46_003352 [Verticillium longisporum]
MARFNLTTVALALLGVSQVQSQCTGPNVNAATISLITEFEGWYPNIYIDPVGLPTVGYGHLCADSSCSDVRYPIPLSRANGEQLLRDDIAGFQNCITLQTASSVVLNANQRAALTIIWPEPRGVRMTSEEADDDTGLRYIRCVFLID